MTSWLSQQFGRRNYFAVSIIIFYGSLFFYVVMLQTFENLLLSFCARFGGGALLVTAQTIITESYPCQGWRRAIWNGCYCRLTLGPPLGGYLVIIFALSFISISLLELLRHF
jgi:DHA2 family multidrug resistance protein